MTDDEREVQRMFEAYRDARAPGTVVQDRVWRSVEAQLTASGGGGDAGGQPAGGGAGVTFGTGTKVLLAGGAIAGALALGFWLQPSAQPSHEPETAFGHTTAAEAPQRAAAGSAQGEPAPPDAPAAEPAPTEGEVAHGSAPDNDREPAAARPPAARAHKPPAPTLAAEMSLMTAAQRAANAGRHADALRLLSRHRRRFPDGALAEEREAERVMALCALGRAQEASRTATAFLERFEGSPLSARVRGGCAGASP